jgi:hypothetical protein
VTTHDVRVDPRRPVVVALLGSARLPDAPEVVRLPTGHIAAVTHPALLAAIVARQ